MKLRQTFKYFGLLIVLELILLLWLWTAVNDNIESVSLLTEDLLASRIIAGCHVKQTFSSTFNPVQVYSIHNLIVLPNLQEGSLKLQLSSKESSPVFTQNYSQEPNVELTSEFVIQAVLPSPPEVIQQTSSSVLFTPSVILSPQDLLGIGDQLYRYAFSYSTAKNLNTTLYLAIADSDTTANRRFKSNERVFALDQFNIDNTVKFIKAELIQEIPTAKRLHLTEIGPWKKTALPRDRIIIIEDYWQAEMYWAEYREEIKRQFVLKSEVLTKITADPENSIMHTNIKNSESIAVHIRRGDFAREGAVYRVLPISYQIRAMKLFKTTLLKGGNLTYFIFSDDILYTKSVLQDKFNSDELVFMSSKNSSSITDFYLMTNCKHFIITNSGFSWWAAYLGNYKDKFVIAPFPRHRFRFYDGWGKRNVYRKHNQWIYWNKSYPETWITLNPFESYEDSM